MISAVTGPLVVEPEWWTLVFSRRARSWQQNLLVVGKYKHVRAYAYVPFLHVWVFYDVNLRGTSIVVAANGEPANQMIASWIAEADLIRMRRLKSSSKNYRGLPVLGFCVPAIKRLMGLPSTALRPDVLYRDCLRAGAEIFQA